MQWDSRFTLALAILATIAYALGAWYILNLHAFSSIESTRLILVLTLSIAMLGFGALLIARALFPGEKDEGFQNRFRLAREIFLVFSGVFGTIIGFYFGTSDQDTATNPAVEVAYAEGQVTAVVTGGAEPFIGVITMTGGTAGGVMTANKRTLTYNATSCPEDASILVIDGRGRRAESTVNCDRGASDAPNAQTPASGNAADQNAVASNAGNTAP